MNRLLLILVAAAASCGCTATVTLWYPYQKPSYEVVTPPASPVLVVAEPKPAAAALSDVELAAALLRRGLTPEQVFNALRAGGLDEQKAVGTLNAAMAIGGK